MTNQNMTQLSADDPLAIAWKEYKQTPSYENTRKWALHENHVDGSLWAAFSWGYEYQAGGKTTIDQLESTSGMLGVLLRDVYNLVPETVKDRICSEIKNISECLQRVNGGSKNTESVINKSTEYGLDSRALSDVEVDALVRKDNALKLEELFLHVVGRENVGNKKVVQTLAFFRSVIKSGEDWDERCQEAYDQAIHSLQSQEAEPYSELAYRIFKELGPDFPGSLGHVREVVERAVPQPPKAQIPEGWKIGNLVTMNEDEYPALGEWFTQIWSGDDVVARVYGKDHEEIQERLAGLLSTPPTNAPLSERVEGGKPKTLSNAKAPGPGKGIPKSVGEQRLDPEFLAETAGRVEEIEISQEPKYTTRNGKLVNRASGEQIPDDEPVFIFRARDKHARAVLKYYACQVSPGDHRSAVVDRIEDFARFAGLHPERMKDPDTAKSIMKSPRRETQSKRPWQQSPLDQWSICGMNHYHVDGEKRLFVSMTKDGLCITEEGKDDYYLWSQLYRKAQNQSTGGKDNGT